MGIHPGFRKWRFRNRDVPLTSEVQATLRVDCGCREGSIRFIG